MKLSIGHPGMLISSYRMNRKNSFAFLFFFLIAAASNNFQLVK